MKLFVFTGEETEWVAANSREQACETLKGHYGINDSDIAGSYDEVYEVDPSEVVFDTDEIDTETEETITTTAAVIMSRLISPAVICSTFHGVLSDTTEAR